MNCLQVGYNVYHINCNHCMLEKLKLINPLFGNNSTHVTQLTASVSFFADNNKHCNKGISKAFIGGSRNLGRGFPHTGYRVATSTYNHSTI